jgi:hypothetical protein
MSQPQRGRLYWQTSHGGIKLDAPRLVMLLVAAGSIEHPRQFRGPRNVLVQPMTPVACVGNMPEGVVLGAVGAPYVRPFRGLRRAREYEAWETAQ